MTFSIIGVNQQSSQQPLLLHFLEAVSESFTKFINFSRSRTLLLLLKGTKFHILIKSLLIRFINSEILSDLFSYMKQRQKSSRCTENTGFGNCIDDEDDGRLVKVIFLRPKKLDYSS